MAIDIPALVTRAYGIVSQALPDVPVTVTLSGSIQSDPLTYTNGVTDSTPVFVNGVTGFWKEHLRDDANLGIKAGDATLTVDPAEIPGVDRETITTVTKGNEAWKVTGSSGKFAFKYTLSRTGKGGA